MAKKDNSYKAEVLVKSIVKDMNNRTETGIRLHKSFKEKFRIDLAPKLTTAGGRKNKFDIISDKLRIEVKSGKGKNKASKEKPWKNGVEFINIPGKDFLPCEILARIYYNDYLSCDEFNNKLKIDEKVPSYEEWLKKDAFRSGATSKYVIKFKEILNKNYLNIRRELNKKVLHRLNNLSAEEKDQTKKQLEKHLECLNKKDYWLSVYENDETTYKYDWYPKVEFKGIRNIKYEYNKTTDIYCIINIETNYGPQDIKGSIRFKNTLGVSNISINFS